MMSEDSPFGFTPAWFALGVITDAQLMPLRAEWARGEDQNPEHYRWRAFLGFLDTERPLTPSVASALYHLGAVDADRAMGEAMMRRIVELTECPLDVLAVAGSSGIRHLVRAVERRRAAI